MRSRGAPRGVAGFTEFIERLFGTVGSEANQPLYFLLLYPWVSVFGTSERALQCHQRCLGSQQFRLFFLVKSTIGEPAARRRHR